jgi:pentapeptide MXKDX repeat protein
MLARVRTGLFAGLMLTTVLAASLAAQDSTTMKPGGMAHDQMGKDKMDKDRKGTDKMGMDHGMGAGAMAPHGMFAGAHDHVVSGSYSITMQEDRAVLVLGDDFSLDGAPDPYIVLSADDMGSGMHTLNLGKLEHKKGSSTFVIPAGTDLGAYHQVLVWCKKFNVTLGKAELASGGAMMHN